MTPFLRSLSFRLLILTAFFVMLSEVLIYTPSIARFRLTYLEERLASAHLAALALQGAPDGMVTEELAEQLLNHAGAHSIVARRTGSTLKSIARPSDRKVDAEFDLRDHKAAELIYDAVIALAQSENRIIKVIGRSPKDASVLLAIELDEAPMRSAMYDYSWRILELSVVISLITAALVFLSLRWLMVLPMQTITASLVSFRRDPEDYTSDIQDTGRSDEIGIAMSELASMKARLRTALRQRTRLATLGTAVNKINHDLRNMLATATLISDRLAESEDENVRRITPPLIRAIDRAARLCSQTISFTQDTQALEIRDISLVELLNDVEMEIQAGQLEPFSIDCQGLAMTIVRGDRDQLFRVFANLANNAAAAGATTLTVRREPGNGRFRLSVGDDGPGIPEGLRDQLFKPFHVSTKKDGAGLGLTIARDIAQAHGGSLSLAESGDRGAEFHLDLPGSPQDR
ncbi:MAG: HAMP domain-containing sensor histidine kinase [Proteobacteria bacterium]|nr:HAMP domain-containing sensor histidine kinase [Pseudomonadota bacterium]